MNATKSLAKRTLLVSLSIFLTPLFSMASSTATYGDRTVTCEGGISMINGEVTCLPPGNGAQATKKNKNLEAQIDLTAQVSTTATLGKNVQILGNSIIGDNVVIGANVTIENSIVKNSIIGANSVIKASNIQESTVGANSQLEQIEAFQEAIPANTNASGEAPESH